MRQCHQTVQKSKRMVEHEVSTVEQHAWLFVIFYELQKFRLYPQNHQNWQLRFNFCISITKDCLFYILCFMTSDVTQTEIATEDNQTTLKFAQYTVIICLVHNHELYLLIYYFAWWKQYKRYHSTYVIPIIEVSNRNLPFISEISFT